MLKTLIDNSVDVTISICVIFVVCWGVPTCNAEFQHDKAVKQRFMLECIKTKPIKECRELSTGIF